VENQQPGSVIADTPFDSLQEQSYRDWREQKLQDYPRKLDQLVVEIKDPLNLTDNEFQALMKRLRKTNMAIYAGPGDPDSDRDMVRGLARRFGLEHLDNHMGADDDAISSLTVQQDALHKGFIPYTTRPIAWHTDGYYNDQEHQILGMVLHCVRPAAEGGANQLLDHEILYMMLRDRDPRYIQSLMHPEAMTIPENVMDGKLVRPARTGPVFSILQGGQLHMRYTDRSRSILWRDDPMTREAVEALKALLKSESPYRFEGRLAPGQGLICNNVLHTRSGFEDANEGRLLYRARYYDRIANT